MPVATLCAAASSGSARVPEPAIDSFTHVVSFVSLETRAIKDFEPAAAKTFPHGTKYRPTPDREAFNHKTLTSDPTRKVPPNATPTPCPATN